MNMLSTSEIMEQNTTIFRDVLENDEINLNAETTADDIEEWDSLTHIQVIVAIERHYRIRFTTSEITSYKNVGEFCDSIQKKLLSKAS